MTGKEHKHQAMVDAISYVVQRLTDFLTEKVVFILGVRDDVTWLRDKLQWMTCFLKDVEERQQNVDNRMRQWISDIRDLAYDAEDIIDDFILKVEEKEKTLRKMGLKDRFKKSFSFSSKQASLTKQTSLFGIGEDIKALKTKLEDIQRNCEIFNVKEGSNCKNEKINQIRRETPYEENDHVVGFEEDSKELMLKLDEEVKYRRVISIVGMGGLGKSTIARKLYNTKGVTDKFLYRAWVSVSKDYKVEELLQRAIKSFKNPKTKEELEWIEKMKVEDLESHLRGYLEGNRYLLVLDDVWDINAWASLRRAFPDNKNGSRVIVTTRNKGVARRYCDETTCVHELPFLKKKESWELFCKKTFPNYDEVGENKNSCPPSFESLAVDMVNKCRGLPLAIVVLGGLLRGKSLNEWLKLKDHIWRHVRNDSDHVKLILELSFNDLPHHLKLCFLYFGLLPEDYEIEYKRLYWLWEAEDFIKESEEPFEGAYLQDLIDRSLIQVVETGWGRITKCRVHDLLRDLAIEKSKEINFLYVYDGNIHSVLAPKCRRLACHCGFMRFVSQNHSELRLRTLLCFNPEMVLSEDAELETLFTKLRLLRVLHIQKLSFGPSDKTTETKLSREIGKLIHLRYLRLSGIGSAELLRSIGNFRALQTLEVIQAHPITLPNELCNAVQLKHLFGAFKWPFRVDNLTNLETLKSIVVEDQMVFKPMDLINLRELWVKFQPNGNKVTLDSIGRLRNLQSLDLTTLGRFEIPSLQPLSHCQNLFQLRLRLHWKPPTEVHQFPPNLKYLYIGARGLSEDPMPVLEKLPNLTILHLEHYCGSKLACSAEGFPKLEFLVVVTNGSTGELEVEEGGMPVLKGLCMNKFRLSSISERLRSIPSTPNFNSYVWPY